MNLYYMFFFFSKVKNVRTPTSSFYKPWVGIISDEGNGQLSEVELEGTSDDVYVFVGV